MDNSIQAHQKELCNKLWAMANALRGNMEAYEFKNYILGMIFYYYLSDRTEKYMVNLLKDDGISYEEAWADEEYKAAVVSGLANAEKLIQQIESGECNYDFIEVMACRRGCIMGGGQPVDAHSAGGEARAKGLYAADVNTQIKKSNENPLVQSLYDGLLKGKEHKLLHRNFNKPSQ